jgi:hypothetical protein
MRAVAAGVGAGCRWLFLFFLMAGLSTFLTGGF